MKAASWRDLAKDRLEVSNPQYFAQIQLYMAYLNLQECLFTSLNKDTAELYHELIPFNAAVASYYSDRAVTILKATESNEFLPRIATKPDWYELSPLQNVRSSFSVRRFGAQILTYALVRCGSALRSSCRKTASGILQM
jgi:hypothetical protein